MERKFVTKEAVLALVRSVQSGEFYSMIFERVAPKCPVCGKSDKKWAGLEKCPHCGAVLSKERETLAQNGVAHPTHCEEPKGVGESAKDAALLGRIKYFDPKVVNADGTLGNYRQCYAKNVKRLKIRGTEYVVL